jgi:hemoglobin
MRAIPVVAALALAACGGGAYRDPSAGAAPAPAAASAVPGQPTLFTRLGGMPAITAVVSAFVDRVAADERINGFFRGVDVPNLKRLLGEQICAGTGGGCRYTGRSMPESHRGMNLTNAHFDALVEDLVATLNQFNVPAREQQELLAVLGPMRRDIVGQ